MKAIYNTEFVKSNMEDVLIQTDLATRKEAKEWFPKANQFAQTLGKQYNVNPIIVSGLISCLSPQKNWFHNMVLTEDFLKSRGETCRHTGQQVEKAKAIYFIRDCYDTNIMTLTEGILNGQKTVNFFMNITKPENPEYVTLDSHMCQLMSGDFTYKTATNKQYLFLKQVLQEYATENKMLPSEMQSLLWLTWRKIKPRRI
jgi:hypothetical protein